MRTKNGTVGLASDKNAWVGLLASVEIDGKSMSVKLYPLELSYESPTYRRGLPRITTRGECLARVKELSSAFGTEIQIHDGIGSLLLEKFN
jgi:hypothetical protein